MLKSGYILRCFFLPCCSVDESSKRGKVLTVLCEQELLAFDLEAPK